VTLWAVVPAKDFARAKSRLAPVLDDSERSLVAQQLLTGVLAAVRDCGRITQSLVLTDSKPVANLALGSGHEAMLDLPDVIRLCDIVDRGLGYARARGASKALVVMADLPRVTPDALSTVARALDNCDQVAVADRRGRSTNVLGVRLDRVATTAFGEPQSFQQHATLARNAHRSAVTLESDALAFDVDIPEDYRDWIARP
jgi:2-phospho-L-lactate guanylyltransferase